MPRFRYLIAFLLVAASSAMGSVTLSGTRLVYPAGAREVTFSLSNEGTQPALVQAWVDDGDSNATATSTQAPFYLTPPIFRLEPAKGQMLRIMFTGAALPADRESVFWLNVLDIPPAPKQAADSNYMQLAVRSRIKLFYRPARLPGSPQQATEDLRWRLVTEGARQVLRASNASAFHVSLSQASLIVQGQEFHTQGGMVPPFGSLDLPLPTLPTPLQLPARVRYESLDDYGGSNSMQAPLQP